MPLERDCLIDVFLLLINAPDSPFPDQAYPEILQAHGPSRVFSALVNDGLEARRGGAKCSPVILINRHPEIERPLFKPERSFSASACLGMPHSAMAQTGASERSSAAKAAANSDGFTALE